ncbi:hypothetical protein MLC59_02045 [Marinobacter bryozoorum]|uniref:hypothetical protein n=1 Tax=Marinobacter bryozoorum TaxID=256324 RepID=UPI0020049882|nr:hypothetical protein [Marinobacter bryozoorum]MCK7542951.1 hypothetical protein [Marinobacter bryozoorum]
MIAKLLTSKALPWVAGAVLALVLAMAAALLYLNSQNDRLSEKVGNLQQQNEQLTETARRLSEDYQALQLEVERRDELVTRTLQEKQAIEGNARETINELRRALEGDTCAIRPHPGAVADSLRHNAGDRVQD